VNNSQVAARTMFWLTTTAIADTAMTAANTQNASG
jgi:hypothetical protein